MKRFIPFTKEEVDEALLTSRAKELRRRRFDITMELRGINKRLREIKMLECGCPRIDRFSMCVNQAHVQQYG